MRRVRWIGGVAAVLVALIVAAGAALASPRPEGVVGPEAEALADRVEAAIDAEAWARTGAVRFAVLGDTWLWDRERGLVWTEDRKGVVITEAWRPMGRAFRDGVEVGGDWKDRRVEGAYTRFVNGAFWAFGANKIRDEGTTRAFVAPDGLQVTYGSGGVTPGDAYLWTIGPDGLPTHLSIWARVLPIPGLRARWTGWVTLPTGARVATSRRLGPFGFSVTDLDAAEHLAQLVPGEDPFAPMFR